MKIFISHSQKDKAVAKEFKKLFEDFAKIYPGKQEVFLSSDITSDQIQTGRWKADFEKNLKDSTVFVVLVTPNSLHSTWVTYEIGYALALEENEEGVNGKNEKTGIKKIIPIGIRGVDPKSFFLNGYNMQTIKEKQDIIKLLNRTFGSTERFNDIWCKENEERIKKLLAHCVERCVYFVGSKPTNESDDKKWDEKDEIRIKGFLEDLTKKLIDNDIKVSSFPSVEEVGQIVCEAALDAKHPEKYEIAGLYQFDKMPENKNGEEIDPNTWKRTLDGFRNLYLANKSSMIIIGGKEHTKEEFEVAEKIDHIEIFPIPCARGFGEDLFIRFSEKKEWHEKFRHPCCDCYKKGEYKGKKECGQIDKFVERLSQYIFIDEDERES